MNRNQLRGKVKDVVGGVQRKVGEMTGSTSQQIKGTAKQVQGKMQKEVGDATEAVRNADRKTRR